jgi:hypothetical protein
MNWKQRYAHEGVPTDDLEALVGHLISDPFHKYPAENMRNLLRDYAGEFGSPRIPLSEVYTQLSTHHYYEHKGEK